MTDAWNREATIRKLTASGLFDTVYYRRYNDKVACTGQNPGDYIIDYGWPKNRWPIRYFDLPHYLQAAPTEYNDPLRGFNVANYRRAHLSQPSRAGARSLRPDQH